MIQLVYFTFLIYEKKKRGHELWACSRMPAPSFLTFCPYQDTFFQPLRTGRSRQPPLPASWTHSAGCPSTSQTWCLGNPCSAQTLVRLCANPVSEELLQPVAAFMKKNQKSLLQVTDKQDLNQSPSIILMVSSETWWDVILLTHLCMFRLIVCSFWVLPKLK